jgi:hypothetical protein
VLDTRYDPVVILPNVEYIIRIHFDGVYGAGSMFQSRAQRWDSDGLDGATECVDGETSKDVGG